MHYSWLDTEMKPYSSLTPVLLLLPEAHDDLLIFSADYISNLPSPDQQIKCFQPVATFIHIFCLIQSVKTEKKKKERKKQRLLRLTGFSSSLQVAWSDVENEPDD